MGGRKEEMGEERGVPGLEEEGMSLGGGGMLLIYPSDLITSMCIKANSFVPSDYPPPLQTHEGPFSEKQARKTALHFFF